MLAASKNLPETNFREKVRCGEVYRNLHGNEMFQKFYYRCLECNSDFDSSAEFEEHVIVHYLLDEEPTVNENVQTHENIISVSSGDDEDEGDNDYLYAFEVASLVEENVSENDLPLPLMQMLSEHSADNSCDKIPVQIGSESDDDDSKKITFPCDGLRRQALHQYSDHCCLQCPAYFTTNSSLQFHLRVHTLLNTVTCQYCYEVFPNIPKLNEHLHLSKRKRIHKQRCAANNIQDNENFQNSKKVRNHVQLQNNDDSSQKQEYQNNSADNGNDDDLHLVRNGKTVKNISQPEMDISQNDRNNCNSNRQNYISSDN